MESALKSDQLTSSSTRMPLWWKRSTRSRNSEVEPKKELIMPGYSMETSCQQSASGPSKEHEYCSTGKNWTVLMPSEVKYEILLTIWKK